MVLGGGGGGGWLRKLLLCLSMLVYIGEQGHKKKIVICSLEPFIAALIKAFFN